MKTTTFVPNADDDLSNPANWDNGLPSRAAGDTAVINGTATQGTVSAQLLQVSALGGVALILTLDVAMVQVGTSTYSAADVVAAAVATQLATDVAAVTAAAGDIKNTRTILGVTGTLATPASPTGCMVSFNAVHNGVGMSGETFAFRCKAAPSGDGNVFVNEVRTSVADSSGALTIELPRSSTWTVNAVSQGLTFDITIPDSDTYVPPNVIV